MGKAGKINYVDAEAVQNVDVHAVESKNVRLKHPGGRPKKDAQENLRKVKVTIYLSPEEKERADQEARRLNIPLSILFKLRLFKEA